MPGDGELLAVTTDSYVVRPLFFPGGDIGELAVNGTVNDLAVAGATPPVADGRLRPRGGAAARRPPARSWRRWPPRRRRAGVAVVAGDTKVVERGKADGLYVTTAGVGSVRARPRRSAAARCRPGDRVLLSGSIGDHGMAVMLARGDLGLEVDLESDTAPLHELTASLLASATASAGCATPRAAGSRRRCNELARAAGVGVRLDEQRDPGATTRCAAACEVLGIDPLFVANEGKLVAVVAPEAADAALARSARTRSARRPPRSAPSRPTRSAWSSLDTAFGGARIVDMLVGDPLPRIC